MPQTRQLAAIMFTDIVGYTTMMGKDTAKALELMRLSKEIQKPLVEKYHGRWLKEMGDGVLAKFNTSLDAVNCAIDIQKAARAEMNGELRIGIHSGDITIENNDVYGDGVNVASRLQSIADPGGIYISESIEKAIKGQSEVLTNYLGEIKLKNVEYGVRVYAIKGVGLPIPHAANKHLTSHFLAEIKRKPLTSMVLLLSLILITVALLYLYPGKSFQNNPQEIAKTGPVSKSVERSIAILPFDNFSPQKEEDQYLCDGFMEEILNQLSKIKSLQVRSRTSVEQYREMRPTSPEIGKKLRVSYLIEGSVQRIGNELKVAVQLIEASKDRHMWQDSYEQPLENIFQMQSDIAKKVADQLKLTLSSEEQKKIETPPTENLQAYDFYLRAEKNRITWHQTRIKRYFENAITLYQRAEKLDPKFVQALNGRALMYWEAQNGSWELYRQIELDSVLILCNRALAIDSTLAETYSNRSRYYRTIGENKKYLSNAQKAWELEPNNFSYIYTLGLAQYESKNYIYGLQLMHKAERLGFGDDALIWIYHQLSLKYLELNDLEMVRHYWKAMLSIYPNFGIVTGGRWYLATCLKQWETADSLMNFHPTTKTDFARLGWYHLLKGNYVEALNYCEKAEALPYQEGSDPHVAVLNFNTTRGMVLWLNNRKKEGEGLLMETLENYYHIKRLSINDVEVRIAAIHSFLGNKQEAYNWLGKSNWYDYARYEILIEPWFANIRAETEFSLIVQEVLENKTKIREEISRLKAGGEWEI